jgi:hypothetical protein
MMTKRMTSLAFAVACIAALATMPAYSQTAGTYGATPGYDCQHADAPQASEGNVAPSASARRNVIESRQYDRALESNRGFRQARIRKECGPISDPELRQSCLSSFNKDEPVGSSASKRTPRSQSGR